MLEQNSIPHSITHKQLRSTQPLKNTRSLLVVYWRPATTTDVPLLCYFMTFLWWVFYKGFHYMDDLIVLHIHNSIHEKRISEWSLRLFDKPILYCLLRLFKEFSLSICFSLVNVNQTWLSRSSVCTGLVSHTSYCISSFPYLGKRKHLKGLSQVTDLLFHQTKWTNYLIPIAAVCFPKKIQTFNEVWYLQYFN